MNTHKRQGLTYQIIAAMIEGCLIGLADEALGEEQMSASDIAEIKDEMQSIANDFREKARYHKSIEVVTGQRNGSRW